MTVDKTVIRRYIVVYNTYYEARITKSIREVVKKNIFSRMALGKKNMYILPILTLGMATTMLTDNKT